MRAEHCARCGAALISANTDPVVVRDAFCARCATREERRQRRTMAVTLMCTGLVAVVSAWQMLVA